MPAPVRGIGGHDAIASPFAIPARQRERLAESLSRAVRAASRHGERLAAVSWRLETRVDPSAVAFASRLPGEPWICFEQPERDGSALAALGAAATLVDRGPGRFARVAARWRELAAAACAEPPEGPPGSGLVAAGGFAFADDGGQALHWAEFTPASLIVPEVSLARRGEEVWCTVAALARGDRGAETLLEGIEGRLAALRVEPLPLLDPHPTERHRIGGALAPEHYEAAVARAVELIAAGRLEKIVLAREVEVHAPRAHDVAAVDEAEIGQRPAVVDVDQSCHRARTSSLAVTAGKRHRIPFAGRRDRHPKRRTLETSAGLLSRRAGSPPRQQ